MLQLSTSLNEISTKISFEFNLGPLLFINVNHLSINRFWWNLSKNGQISLYKVKKIIKDQIFFIKCKMQSMCYFHIDFQFWTKNHSQGTSRCTWLTPGSSMDLGVRRMDPKSQRMVFRDLYRCPHVSLSAFLIHQYF